MQGAITGLVALCVYLATTGGSLATTDAVVTFEVTQNILRNGSTALDAGRMTSDSMVGKDGKYYSPFGIGQSLYNIPFYLAGDALTRYGGWHVGAADTVTKASVAIGSAFAAAGCVWLVYLLAWHAGGGAAGARAAALSLAFGSALWPYSKFGFNAPLTALCLTGGVYGAMRGAATANVMPLVWGGGFLGFALLTRHELVLAAAGVIGWTAWQTPPANRRRAIAAVAAGPLVAGICWLLYNYVRFGNPMYAGHRPAFDTSGFAGLLLSPGGSLFLYSPVAVAGLAALVRLFRHDRRTASLIAIPVLLLFGFYAALEDWLGTRSYGPRYLVPVLPLLVVSLAPAVAQGGRTWRMGVAVAAVAGVLIQVPGVMVDPGKVNVSLGRPGPVTMQERRYEWRLSALALNARAAARQLRPNIRYVTSIDPRPAIPRAVASGSLSDRLTFSLDFWWLYLFYLGVLPAPAALAAPAVLLGAAMMLARSAAST